MKRNLQIYIQVNTFFFLQMLKTIESVLSEECVISSILSHHNKNLKLRTSVTTLGWTSVTALEQTSVTALRWTSVTALCYSSVLFRKLRKIHPRGVRACRPKRPKDAKRRERHPWPFGSSFYMFFLLPLDLPYVNWASQECYLFYLRSSLWSWGISLFYFHGLFLPLSFSHCHSGLSFTILTT